jgi:hypothetical protein
LWLGLRTLCLRRRTATRSSHQSFPPAPEGISPATHGLSPALVLLVCCLVGPDR